MDFVKGLPKSQGKLVIMVFVDCLTKYIHFMGLAHPFSAYTFAQLFLEHVYKLHGNPTSIISDRRTLFLS